MGSAKWSGWAAGVCLWLVLGACGDPLLDGPPPVPPVNSPSTPAPDVCTTAQERCGAGDIMWCLQVSLACGTNETPVVVGGEHTPTPEPTVDCKMLERLCAAPDTSPDWCVMHATHCPPAVAVVRALPELPSYDHITRSLEDQLAECAAAFGQCRADGEPVQDCWRQRLACESRYLPVDVSAVDDPLAGCHAEHGRCLALGHPELVCSDALDRCVADTLFPGEPSSETSCDDALQTCLDSSAEAPSCVSAWEACREAAVRDPHV